MRKCRKRVDYLRGKAIVSWFHQRQPIRRRRCSGEARGDERRDFLAERRERADFAAFDGHEAQRRAGAGGRDRMP